MNSSFIISIGLAASILSASTSAAEEVRKTGEGVLSSAPSTFPAFSGTTSWKL
ncbi:hypothetical protein A2U01_0055455 [Trifolium medium]|uniref:Uncharacterized protein n=1 Tax=Trifolium medium TaxID=97028 RepID=A0A392RDF4_9FABA|nr:hypothetical protein [Trifolium medium]